MDRRVATGRQAGFTLIELIVVIVILGVLAATAIPKFADLGSDARQAKMMAVAGSLQSAAATFHAVWLVKGSPSGGVTITMESVTIPYQNGYPDVGGDGPGANAATTAPTSGAAIAAGLAVGGVASTEYTLTATAGVLTVAEKTKATCLVTYTESVGGAPPVVNSSAVTAGNC